MSSESSLQKLKKEIHDITECAICTETLTDARVLPCVHSFCLKCLQSYGKDKVTADKSIECPLCRKPFNLESGRFEELPVNHFINKLIDANNMSDKAETGKPSKRFCDICSEMNHDESAYSYCVECREYLCSNCLQRHGIQKATKSHKTVTLAQMPSPEELLKMSVSYCQTHPSQELNLYCGDCLTTACVVCYVAKHKEHKCTDITNSSNELSQQIDQSLVKINDQLKETEAIVKQIDLTVDDFEEQIKTAEASVTCKYDEMKALLVYQHITLLDQLREFRSQRLKELQTLKEESECELMMMKNFMKYWEEVKSKGSVCDIVQAASNLSKRAEDLVGQHEAQQNERSDKSQSSYRKIEFNPAESTFNKIENLLGQISERSACLKGSCLDWRSLLQDTKTQLVSHGGCSIVGISVFNTELFIVRSSYPNIDVYNLKDLKTVTNLIKVSGLTRAGGMVSCGVNKCLYVSNQVKPAYIHKINIESTMKSGWKIQDYQPCGLSISRRQHLLVSCVRAGRIHEYDTMGTCLRSIELTASMNELYAAIELKSGRFAIAVWNTVHFICITDSCGNISNTTCDGPQIDCPMYIEEDVLGNILVVDNGLNKLRIYSSALLHLGDVSITSSKISSPTSFCWDSSNSRLFVGDNSGRILSISTGAK